MGFMIPASQADKQGTATGGRVGKVGHPFKREVWMGEGEGWVREKEHQESSTLQKATARCEERQRSRTRLCAQRAPGLAGRLWRGYLVWSEDGVDTAEQIFSIFSFWGAADNNLSAEKEMHR